MRCVICGNSEIEKRQVEEEFRVGSDLILFPIEVLVCSSCGERYYDRRTMRLLEEVEEKIKAEEIDLRAVGRVLKPVAV